MRFVNFLFVLLTLVACGREPSLSQTKDEPVAPRTSQSKALEEIIRDRKMENLQRKSGIESAQAEFRKIKMDLEIARNTRNLRIFDAVAMAAAFGTLKYTTGRLRKGGSEVWKSLTPAAKVTAAGAELSGLLAIAATSGAIIDSVKADYLSKELDKVLEKLNKFHAEVLSEIVEVENIETRIKALALVKNAAKNP